MRRTAACAGQFYEADPDKLRQQVESLVTLTDSPPSIKAVVSPHAGLMYSGGVAGAMYGRIQIPSRAILVGPNHTGYGPPLSIYPEGEWELPGGLIRVDRALAADLLRRYPPAAADTYAHTREHCLEVQLPFLYYLRPYITIVPIVVGTQDLGQCLALGDALGTMINESDGERPLLIASTDMTHCGPGFGQWPPAGMTADAFARIQDRVALGALHTMDEEQFHRTIEQHQVTMCGYAPTTVVLRAARILQARSATLVCYGTSADSTGDVDRVVGYASLLLD